MIEPGCNALTELVVLNPFWASNTAEVVSVPDHALTNKVCPLVELQVKVCPGPTFGLKT